MKVYILTIESELSKNSDTEVKKVINFSKIL